MTHKIHPLVLKPFSFTGRNEVKIAWALLSSALTPRAVQSHLICCRSLLAVLMVLKWKNCRG